MLILIRFSDEIFTLFKFNLMNRSNGFLNINKKESIGIKNSMTNSIIKLL